MGQKIRKESDAAKRVRRVRGLVDRMIASVDAMARDLERGRVPEEEPGKTLPKVLAMLALFVTLEVKLYEYDIEGSGGVPGREPPMDLAAARIEVMGRLARLADRA